MKITFHTSMWMTCFVDSRAQHDANMNVNRVIIAGIRSVLIHHLYLCLLFSVFLLFFITSFSPSMWVQTSLFHHDNFPVHEARHMKTWFFEIGVEEFKQPTQSPDLLTPLISFKMDWNGNFLLPCFTDALTAE